MTPTTSSDATDLDDRLVGTVSTWPGVNVGPHQLGTFEFTLGDREIGHVHGDRVIDINFPKRMKDALVATGETNEHRADIGGGWTSFYVESADDVERAIRLLRLSYLYTALTLRRKPAGKAALAELDLDAEIDRLETNEDVRAIFDRARP